MQLGSNRTKAVVEQLCQARRTCIVHTGSFSGRPAYSQSVQQREECRVLLSALQFPFIFTVIVFCLHRLYWLPVCLGCDESLFICTSMSRLIWKIWKSKTSFIIWLAVGHFLTEYRKFKTEELHLGSFFWAATVEMCPCTAGVIPECLWYTFRGYVANQGWILTWSRDVAIIPWSRETSCLTRQRDSGSRTVYHILTWRESDSRWHLQFANGRKEETDKKTWRRVKL